MAIDACGRIGIADLNRFRVIAAVVRSLLIGMARGAGNLFRRGFVRRAGDIRMAVHASEHAAMDRVFEFLRIYLEADGLAIDFVCQACVAVACQAFINGRFGRLFLGCCGERRGS